MNSILNYKKSYTDFTKRVIFIIINFKHFIIIYDGFRYIYIYTNIFLISGANECVCALHGEILAKYKTYKLNEFPCPTLPDTALM